MIGWYHHHHQLNVHLLQDQSRVWTADSQQHKVDNQPLATLRISRLIIATFPCFSLVTIRHLSIHGNIAAILEQVNANQLFGTLDTSSAVMISASYLDNPAWCFRILCALAFRCLHGSAPPYWIQDNTAISLSTGDRILRSNWMLESWWFRTNTKTDFRYGHLPYHAICMEQFTLMRSMMTVPWDSRQKKIKNFSLLVYIASSWFVWQLCYMFHSSHAYWGHIEKMLIGW